MSKRTAVSAWAIRFVAIGAMLLPGLLPAQSHRFGPNVRVSDDQTPGATDRLLYSSGRHRMAAQATTLDSPTGSA